MVHTKTRKPTIRRVGAPFADIYGKLRSQPQRRERFCAEYYGIKRNPYRYSRKEAREERASDRRPKQKENHYQEGDGHCNEQAPFHESEQQFTEESDEFSENERYYSYVYDEFGDEDEEKSDPGQDESIDPQLEENHRTRRDNVACHRDDQYSLDNEGHLRDPRVRFAGSAGSIEEESVDEDHHI